MTLVDLPVGWTRKTLGELANSFDNGLSISRPGVEVDGTAIIRVGAIRSSRLDLSDLRYTGLEPSDRRISRYLLAPGDLLFTRVNGNPQYVGECAAVPIGVSSLVHSDKYIRMRVCGERVDSNYLAYACSTRDVREQIGAVTKTTAGQASIAGADLKRVIVPIPPREVQHRIVSLLDQIESIKAQHRAQLALLDELFESARYRAFRGVLPT